tara:strand:- start:1439 stop:4048 length:2610 start_codon:yes stop_codon:yes gene_type:complete
MKSNEIRNKFLNFFKDKGHEIFTSDSMVIKNDPTLMFTNAGMNQFKDLFLGNSKIKFPRISNSQKCLRVSGKHNDLGEVGHDTYHHTMFEMLGNWSFGNYFKKDAIHWAWELLTRVFKIDKELLYVTVFEGNQKDNLEFDKESYNIWKEYINEDRIIKFSKEDNFWEMGEIGPCGPCSEIHIDIRSKKERLDVDGKTLINTGHPQVVELWNLVFMQYNRKSDGLLEKLPNTHVDTGMGFERLCMVLQGVDSNYDTDLFQPIINQISLMSNKTYGVDSKIDIAIRVIADHIRAISFSIADGQLPSNNGAGYVIRRILRRAVRYGYTFLNFKDPFLYKLVKTLVNQMGDQFSELKKEIQLIESVIKEEEKTFLNTLENGIRLLNNLTLKTKIISGKLAFELYDTYGFPIDLIELIALEKGCQVDLNGFHSYLDQQKNRSRKATNVKTHDWVELQKIDSKGFVGYDNTEFSIYITRYRKVQSNKDNFFQLVFNHTPFYPEGGGQIGDKGYIECDDEKIFIFDTKKENNLILHYVKKIPNDLSLSFKAVVDKENRLSTSKNHTATHLLHHALKEVLGDHIEQKGSLVNSEYLRFDFSHFSKLEDDHIKIIEQKINDKIRFNFKTEEYRNIPIDKANKMGAIALFGEKYSDVVRCIKVDKSIELCGGTHVNYTSQIGLFKIISETAVASGVRRIEAITSEKAIEYYKNKLEKLKEISTLIKSNDVVKAVENLILENKILSKKNDTLIQSHLKEIKLDLLNNSKKIHQINFIASSIDLDLKNIKSLAFQLKKEQKDLFLILANKENSKSNLLILISENISKKYNLHAGEIINVLSKEIDGAGGGQQFFAVAGGQKPSGVSKVLKMAEQILIRTDK